MTVMHTYTLTPGSLDPSTSHQVYCGLDNCVTVESREELGATPPAIYDFSRAMQGPYLEIMQRGFAVNEPARRAAATALHSRIARLTQQLNELSYAAWDRPLVRPGTKLPHFTVLQDFFYSTMKLPEIWLSQKGQRKLSANREALEKLEELH